MMQIYIFKKGKEYDIPHSLTPPTKYNSNTLNMLLHIPYIDPTPKVPRQPLYRMVHNPHAKVAHNYSMVDDLKKSPIARSTLEVLQTFPSQQNTFLSTLGTIDLSNSRLMTFHPNQSAP